jgi:hypothetical protein
MSIFVHYQKCEFQFPVQKEPIWHRFVDRWNHLDAYAYGLVQACFQWKMAPEAYPDFIILASPEASNRTDFQFAHTGGLSPSKFVHTLPNVRSSSLCQVLKWNGPLLCIQNDPHTQVTALREGADLMIGHWNRIWVLSITRNGSNNSFNNLYSSHWFGLSSEYEPESVPMLEIVRPALKEPLLGFPKPKTDAHFLIWLGEDKSPQKPFRLPGNYEIKMPQQAKKTSSKRRVTV